MIADEIQIAILILGIVIAAFVLHFIWEERQKYLKHLEWCREHNECMERFKRETERAEDRKRREIEEYTETRERLLRLEYEKRKKEKQMKENNFAHKREKEFSKRSEQAKGRWK